MIYQLSFNKKSIIQVAITLISYTKFVYIWPCLNSLSITLFWKQGVIYTKIPILMPCQRRNLVFLLYFTLYYVCSYICSYVPWRLLLLLVIIISCLLFLSSCCLSSSALLSFSQGFLQAPKFPTSSGGKLLRCHSSSERESSLWRGRVGCHTAQNGKEKIKWKRRKTRKGAAVDTLALPCT